jgi:hypothetical protein
MLLLPVEGLVAGATVGFGALAFLREGAPHPATDLVRLRRGLKDSIRAGHDAYGRFPRGCFRQPEHVCISQVSTKGGLELCVV